jgi:hypothetical protein
MQGLFKMFAQSNGLNIFFTQHLAIDNLLRFGRSIQVFNALEDLAR